MFRELKIIHKTNYPSTIGLNEIREAVNDKVIPEDAYVYFCKIEKEGDSSTQISSGLMQLERIEYNECGDYIFYLMEYK